MSRMGEHYINVLNAEEDARQRQEFKRQERLAGERWLDDGPSLKVADPAGGRKRHIVNSPVFCVQCGEGVSTLVFCCDECRRAYNKDVAEWLDGIQELLPSGREK